LNRYGNIDSKFRFVILASKRAKQLLKGAKPKIKIKTKNPIRVAQAEVRAGVIEYEILPTKIEEIQEEPDRVFVGEGLHDEIIEPEELPAAKVGAVAEEDVEEDAVDDEEEDADAEDDEEEGGGETEEEKDE
jgi:DNA-directed RNA polymerase subunit K/omega